LQSKLLFSKIVHLYRNQERLLYFKSKLIKQLEQYKINNEKTHIDTKIHLEETVSGNDIENNLSIKRKNKEKDISNKKKKLNEDQINNYYYKELLENNKEIKKNNFFENKTIKKDLKKTLSENTNNKNINITKISTKIEKETKISIKKSTSENLSICIIIFKILRY
jgi:hypothetical protein